MTLLSSLPAVQYLDDTDPYHYTVDNRPLLNLANRDEAIATAFDAALPTIGSASFNHGVKNIDFNALGDTPFTFTLPTGFSTYYLNHIFIIGVSGTFTTARIGIYSSPSQGGYAVMGQTALSPITTVSPNTAGQLYTASAPAVVSTAFTYTTLYINVGTAQGSLSTGHVIFSIRPLF